MALSDPVIQQPVPGAPPPGRRLRRADRREQILAAATRAFARTGFAATSLDDIAAEAGISRVILYRHFDSKHEMYRAVLDRACTRLANTVGADNFTSDSIPTLLRAASDDPDGFRLLFRYAAREPEFRDLTDTLTAAATDVAHRHLAATIPDQRWATWAAQLAPTVAIEAVIAWLDAGQPDPDQAGDRVAHAVNGVIQAAQSHPSATGPRRRSA
jgi:AcrR family transcriptional regulator